MEWKGHRPPRKTGAEQALEAAQCLRQEVRVKWTVAAGFSTVSLSTNLMVRVGIVKRVCWNINSSWSINPSVKKKWWPAENSVPPPPPSPLSPQQKVATPIRIAYNIFFEAQNKMAIQRNTRSSRNFVFWKSQVFRLSLLPVGVSISYHKFAWQHLFVRNLLPIGQNKSICACSTLNRFVKLAEVRVFIEDSIFRPTRLVSEVQF